MPYEIKKSGAGWKVVTKDTGQMHSKKPLSKEQAEKQMAAMYANEPKAKEG